MIGGTGALFDLDRERIDIECPVCRFGNAVTVEQVRLGDVLICRGCKVSIRLQDHHNETRKAAHAVRRALRELEDQLLRIGTVTIRL